MYAAAEQEACCQAVESGHVSGTKAWNAFVSPQVTRLCLRSGKIVGVFEFVPLNSAPGRIRTCAHDSGGRCCSRLLPGKTRAGIPLGERMGCAVGGWVGAEAPWYSRATASMARAVGRLAGAY